ncbi:MAG TPA: MoaD/ThiS family protein [Natronosporangium sp.]|nr:MoaD/ThiS family protein [Natronosporangium sp.]
MSAVVTVRYFAGARAAAGVREEQLPAAGWDRHKLRAALVDRHGPRLGKILGAATLLVNGVAWRDPDQPLADGAVVDVLPPFAGG